MSAADLIPLVAPEFTDNANLIPTIDLATSQVDPAHCQFDAVVANLAAHILTMANRKGVGGFVAGKTEGSLSISMGSPSITGNLSSTSYGQEVQRLNKLCYGLSAMTAWT